MPRMPWYQTWNGNFVNKTSRDEWQKCMNDTHIITLEDMEGWNSYNAITSPHASAEALPSEIYDLSGRRLSNIPQHGAYIMVEP